MKCRMWGILLLVALLAVFCAAGLAEEPLPGVPVEAEEGLYHVIPLNGVPQGITDTDFPVLESFEISPEGETLKPGDTVSFRVKASDSDGMGGVSLRLSFNEEENHQLTRSLGLTFNQSTGFWEGSYTFTAKDPPGRWHVTYATLQDRYGMQTTFHGNSFRVIQRFFPGTVWLENPDYVDQTPEVAKKSIVSNLVFDCVGKQYSSTEPLEMSFDIPPHLYHLYVRISFHPTFGTGDYFTVASHSRDSSIAYDPETGHVAVQYRFPEDAVNGLYYLRQISVQYTADETAYVSTNESLTSFNDEDYLFEYTNGSDRQEVDYEITGFQCGVDGQTLQAGDSVTVSWQISPADESLKGRLLIERVGDRVLSEDMVSGMSQTDGVSMGPEDAVYDAETGTFTATHVIGKDDVYGTYKIQLQILRDYQAAVWDEDHKNIISPEISRVNKTFDTNVMFLFDEDRAKVLRRWDPATNIMLSPDGVATFSVPGDFEGIAYVTLCGEGSIGRKAGVRRQISPGDTWQEETGVNLFSLMDGARFASAKYYCEITLLGDNHTVFDSVPARSGSVDFTRPLRALDGPAKAEWFYEEHAGRLYVKITPQADAERVERYQAAFYFAASPDETPVRVKTSYNTSSNPWADGCYYAFSDKMVQDYGAGCYYFRIRSLPADPSSWLSSAWSELSEPFRLDEVAGSALARLNAIPDGLSAGEVRERLKQISSAELETALLTEEAAAEKLAELEQAIGGGTNVEVKEQVPGVEGRITAVGASLNETVAEGPVKLIVDKPKKQEKLPAGYKEALAVRFSLEPENLKNPKALNVPVLVDMPVPAGMDPDTLVILHYPSSGGAPMVIRPYIYLAGTQTYMQFTLLSFSDFAVTEPLSGDALPGDVNGDGIVDGRDVVRLMNFLAEETDPETGELWAIDEACADLNGDGKVDEIDLLRLVKTLAGEE